MVDLFGGDGGLVAEDAFGGVWVAVVEGEIGSADVDAQLVSGSDGCCDRAKVDADFVDLAGFHELGFEEGVAVASALDSSCDVLGETVGVHINDFHGPIGIWGIGRDVELGLGVSGEGERRGHRFAGVDEHVLAVLGGGLVHGAPRTGFDWAGWRDGGRGRGIGGIGFEGVGPFSGGWHGGRKAAIAASGVRFPVGVQVESGLGESFWGPGLCVVPHVVAH